MRLVLVLAACAGCVYTSADTDGKWSTLDGPCVPVGPTRELVESQFSLTTAPAGNTLLYSGGETVSQLDLVTGDSKIVLRSDGISQFETFGNDIVYYESNGDPFARVPIDIIVDHGARSTSRYERISPRHGEYTAQLTTTPTGIYWYTAPDDFNEPSEHWRWTPDGGVEPFAMDAATLIRTDATSFFYFDPSNRLIVQPQTPGPPSLVVQMEEKAPPPLPIAIDGDELFYVPYRSSDFEGDLIARSADGTERVLVTGQRIINGALDATYVYLILQCDIPFEDRCEDLFRVPRAGGPMQTMFDGEPNSQVFDVEVDACNVYWQQHSIDGGALYASEITP